MKYKCEPCNYSTDHKTKFERHINTQKHMHCIQNASKMHPNESKMHPNDSIINENMFERRFECEYVARSTNIVKV